MAAQLLHIKQPTRSWWVSVSAGLYLCVCCSAATGAWCWSQPTTLGDLNTLHVRCVFTYSHL